ncbi:MAG: hypothetical protein ACYS9X_06095 [Planctomycetota bacterium]
MTNAQALLIAAAIVCAGGAIAMGLGATAPIGAPRDPLPGLIVLLAGVVTGIVALAKMGKGGGSDK